MSINPVKKLIIKIFKHLKWLVIAFILKFKKFNTANSIIIFSEARGGSTWLMELLSKIPGTCTNWEPLHVKKGVVPTSFRFGNYPYLNPEENEIKYRSFFTKVLSLQLNNTWTTKDIKIYSLFNSRYIVTKFVRANLLVPYILNKFSFNIPPIVLLRHPIDTCRSQIKAFENNDIKNKEIKIPVCINNERYVENIDYINQLETRLERKVAIWCINNCPLIDQIDKLDVHVVFYSDLLLNPKKELDKILAAFNLKNHSFQNFKEVEFREASQTDFNNDLKSDPLEQLNKNIHKLDDEMKYKIQEIFDHYNFKLFCAHSALPNKKMLNFNRQSSDKNS